ILRDRLYATLPGGISGPSAGQQAPGSGAQAGFDAAVSRRGRGEAAQRLEEPAPGAGRGDLAVRGNWWRGTGAGTALPIAAAGGAVDGAGAGSASPALPQQGAGVPGGWAGGAERRTARYEAPGPIGALAEGGPPAAPRRATASSCGTSSTGQRPAATPGIA